MKATISPSDRTKCSYKACSISDHKISKGELRIEIISSVWNNFETRKYYHYPCFKLFIENLVANAQKTPINKFTP